MVQLKGLSKELRDWRDHVRGHAVSYGLDFHEVIFEMVEPDEVNEIAALGGFPQRYPHWRFGMEYERLSKSYTYGLSKIYEMVINTDPCYAYLLTSNSVTEQKLVMAHVYGHADFFKHNLYFSHTNRRMIDEMANHAVRVRQYQDRFGVDRVEEFIDACLSIDNLQDLHAPAIKRKAFEITDLAARKESLDVTRIPSKDYLDKFVNPAEYMDQQRKELAEKAAATKKFPEAPVLDVLGFILEHAPLEHWEQDCLSIVRDEAAYFAPQGMTKIMNEGWASYWHSKLMTEHLLTDAEIVDYADVHSGTMAMQPGGFNPYKIGVELYRDIEERWNKGQFGKEWDECEDYLARANWDKKLGQGREKIFQVRKLYNDVTFIDTFLTEDFCRRQKLFTFARNERSERDEIESREFPAIKEKLLQQLTNFGQPVIEIIDANFLNRGELLLTHRHDGRDLKADYAEQTLKNLCFVWKRPVNIQTLLEGRSCRLSFDGTNFSKTDL
jgi:stage V sporulation protein R